MSVSSFSLLVLLYLSYVNLFKELFLYRLLPIGISLCLALTLSPKADAKVTLFLILPKHSDNKFANKSSFNIRSQDTPYNIYSYRKLWFRPTALVYYLTLSLNVLLCPSLVSAFTINKPQPIFLVQDA